MLDKDLWDKSIKPLSIEQLPLWPCPECETGKLTLVKDSVYFRRTAKQYDREEFKKEDFENHVLLGIAVALGTIAERLLSLQVRFSFFLTCEVCGENVAVCGRAEVPSKLYKDVYKDASPANIKTIIPEYFSPHLLIFRLKKEYPREIKEELAKSFSMLFSDSSAAGNKLRTCIELLLDNQKVPSSNSLHSRIVEYQKSNTELGSYLLAIKWLGNEASHAPEIDKKDLLAAYEITEYVLEKIFDEDFNGKRMKRLSDELVKRYKIGG